ncbi:hypothetical protein BDV12DRAFT_204756 [Aspergillus spectabilis]
MAPSNNEILLALIPVEIWVLVIDFLQWESWTALHLLNLSCRDFHEIVSPVLFKTLRIRFPGGRRDSQVLNQDNKHKRLHELLGPDNLVDIHQYVRFLTLCGHKGSTADSHGASLSKLVESLPNLESIRWRSIAFPPHLVHTLKAKQQPPLFYYEGLPLPLVQDDLLLGAPFIKSLNITYSSNPSSSSRNNIEINALGAVILSLPNLKRLVLKYNPGPQILNGADCPPRPIFDLPPATILPPLRVLCLANFAFSPEQAATWARSLAQRQTLHNLDLDGAADMTNLINHLSDCPGAVSGLRSVSFRIHDATRAENISCVTSSLDGLLRQITHLSAFSANDLPKEVLHKVVGHHRSTLRQLRWRHTWFPLLDIYFAGMQELNPIGVRRSIEERSVACIFSPGELRDLAKKLPHVERLGVDLCFRRNTDLPYTHLSALASFQQLKYLELNSPSLERTQTHMLLEDAPLVNESIAEDAFQYIAAEKNRHGKEASAKVSAEASQSRFIQLAIKAGEWESFPWDANSLDRRYIPFAIVCWREGAIGALNTIRRLHVKFKSLLRLSFLEENKFEQAMDVAGLWGGGREGGLDFGPRIW